MLLFYNAQTTNLTFVNKNMRYTIDSYSITGFRIVKDTKYNLTVNIILCKPNICSKCHGAMLYTLSLQVQFAFCDISTSYSSHYTVLLLNPFMS